MSTLVLNRRKFLRWLDGDLLDFRDGKGEVFDDAQFEDAESVLNANGTIIFIDDAGNKISIMRRRGMMYREEVSA